MANPRERRLGDELLVAISDLQAGRYGAISAVYQGYRARLVHPEGGTAWSRGPDLAELLNFCMEHDPGDGTLVRQGLIDGLRTSLLGEPGSGQESLLGPLEAGDSLELGLALRAFRALGLTLTLAPAANASAAPAVAPVRGNTSPGSR